MGTLVKEIQESKEAKEIISPEVVEVVDVDIVGEKLPDEIYSLPTREAYIVRNYLQGMSVKDIANNVNLTQRHTYLILAKPEIKKICNKTKEIVLSELMPMVMEELKEMLLSGNVYARQFAVKEVLKMQSDAERFATDLKIAEANTPKTLEDLLLLMEKK